jgi:hypothetical protein
MRPMAKETHIKTDKKTRWRLGCLGVTPRLSKKSYKFYQTDLAFSGVIIALQSLLIVFLT